MESSSWLPIGRVLFSVMSKDERYEFRCGLSTEKKTFTQFGRLGVCTVA